LPTGCEGVSGAPVASQRHSRRWSCAATRGNTTKEGRITHQPAPHRGPHRRTISRAQGQSRARLVVARLRKTIDAPDAAFDMLETSLAQGRISVPPENYLARIVRFMTTGEWLIERLPDQTPEQGRAANASEAGGVRLRRRPMPEQFWAAQDAARSDQFDAIDSAPSAGDGPPRRRANRKPRTPQRVIALRS
jgi:hypothetical protein